MSRSKIKVKGRGQDQRSRSNVWCKAVHIRGSACRGQQKAIAVKFGVKGGHNRSKGFVCLSVIRGICTDNLADVVDWISICMEVDLDPR